MKTQPVVPAGVAAGADGAPWSGALLLSARPGVSFRDIRDIRDIRDSVVSAFVLCTAPGPAPAGG